MPQKAFAQISVLGLFLLALLGAPSGALAGGVCGGTYIVDSGDTLDRIASKCGTTVSAITAANPGIGTTLSTGQTLTVPGYNYGSTSTIVYDNYDYNYDYNNYPYNNNNSGSYNYGNYNYNNTSNYPLSNYGSIYIVQYGDTFSMIASRYGVSVYDLWLANPYIPNINLIYPGQPIHVPSTTVNNSYNYNYNYGYAAVSSSAGVSTPLSYGTAPAGTQNGHVKLVNRANADVYVSLQGTMRDDTKVINEYPVSGAMDVDVPAGWYVYVAWVGGHKYTGSFQLGGSGNTFITFYSNRVTVQ